MHNGAFRILKKIQQQLLFAFIALTSSHIPSWGQSCYLVSTVAGNGSDGYTGDNGPATSAALNSPTGITTDASGNFYIADNLNNVVRKVTPAGVITTIAGTGVAGYTGDGGPATNATLGRVNDVKLDAAGNLYVICQNTGGDVIRKIFPSGIITTVAGNGAAGFSGDGGPATNASLNSPGSLAIDGLGNLYITDLLNNRIRKVNTSGIISTIAGTGVIGYSGDGGPATAAKMQPNGIILDAFGNIIFSDYLNNTIRKIATTGIITTIAGTGTSGMGGEGLPATASALNRPYGLALDAAGNLYFSEFLNNRLRVINTANIVNTIAGTGAAGYAGDGGPAMDAKFTGPAYIAMDASDNIYVADEENYRIRKLTETGATVGAITGYDSVCQGASIILSDSTLGGVWSSGNVSIATIGSAGQVTGISAGVDTIRYAVTNVCGTVIVTKTITISPLPLAGAITGLSDVCVGATIALADTATGGVWSRANANASVSGGAVTGVSPGVDTISYTVANACGVATATKTIAINPLPLAGTITGLSNVCVGATIALTDTATGGVWSRANAHASLSGGAVTGVSAGVDTVSYTVTNACGAATTSKTITINPLPLAGAITGLSGVCVGATIALTDTATGGVWSRANARAALSGGAVTGVSPGIDTISYTVTNACGAATATKTIAVNSLPLAGSITGLSGVCVDATIALTDTATGGIWGRTNANASVSGGSVTGLSAGADTISYTVTNACGAATATKTIAINPLPLAGAITGLSGVCVGATIALTDTATGGIWSRTNAHASVSGGSVTGLSAGVDTIRYSVTNSCGTATAIHTVTVRTIPNAGIIIGADSVCAGDSIAVVDTVTGGVWSGSNSSATIMAGIIHGVYADLDTIKYRVGNICGTDSATKIIAVLPLPAVRPIIGDSTVCIGATITLTDAATGGIWSGSNAHAFLSGSVVTGAIAGMDTVIYTVINSCGSATATKAITIEPLPACGTIEGDSVVCLGFSITLSDTAAGGTWSADNGKATINSAGVVSGVTSGWDTVFYTVTNLCGTATAQHVIHVLPVGFCQEASVTNASLKPGSLRVFPNPNAGAFTLLFTSDNDDSLTVTITTLLGEKVKEMTLASNQVSEVSLHQPAGVYTICARNKGEFYTEKIVLVR